MERIWEEIDHDEASGRRIFKSDAVSNRSSGYGGNDHSVAADFEVRDAQGRVLLKQSGSADGEYWCGVFLWFVEGAAGRQVRLDESDEPVDKVYDVPDLAE